MRFVARGDALFALKELPPPLASREYRILTELARHAVPAVEAVGVVLERRSDDGEALPDVLITRYLEFALPYRLILGRPDLPAPKSSMRAALA